MDQQLPIDVIDMTEDEDVVLQAMNTELDKQLEQDIDDISSLINPKTAIIDKITAESVGLAEEESMYLNINAEIDKQIAQDMEAINNYINRSDSDSYVRRLDFFDRMKESPINKQVDAATTNHVLCQYTETGTIQWHECPKCDYKVKEKKRLQDHILSKHDSTSSVQYWLKCLQCKFKTRVDVHLRRHVKLIHSQKPPFKCDECPANYPNTLMLAKHLRTAHRMNDGFACDRCFYVAEDEDDVKAHITAEHLTLNVSWYKCPKCAYRTVRKINLDRHIMYKHSNKF